MMKLCIVSGIYPPDIGGPAVYVARLARALHDRGFQITLVIPEGKGEQEAPVPFSLHTFAWGSSVLSRYLAAYRKTREHAAAGDLLFVNGFGVAAVMAGRRAKVPVVLKVVGDFAWERARNRGLTTLSLEDFQESHGGASVQALKRTRNFFVRRAGLVITPSRYLAEIVRGWGIPSEKIRIVYNAVEAPAEPLPESNQAKASLDLQGPTIISVGRLVNWKGMDGLIRVFPGLPGNARLVIVGDGPEAQRLRNLASETGLKNRIRFTGALPRRDVLRYLKAADILVLNSTYEGLSHLLLEGLMCGTAIVASDCGGNPEVVEDGVNGFLVRAGEDSELSERLVQLLKDPGLRASFVTAGYQKLESFGWPRLLEETIHVFQEAVGGC